MIRQRRFVAVVALLALAAVLAFPMPAGFSLPGTRAAGPPVYPDLRTATPARFLLDSVELEDGKTHHVVRFDNLVENWGGPLEITANFATSRDLYQDVYDDYSGGNRVIHQRVSADLIFHPQHNHFHFTDFASYLLLKKDSSGAYIATTRRGSKTTFCMIDVVRASPIGPVNGTHTSCGNQRQGLSAGWGDVYTRDLYGQWIDFGTSPVPDGEYAIQSTADPLDKLMESNDENNTAVGFFKVAGGKIQGSVAEPVCGPSPDKSFQVGESVSIVCTRLEPGTAYDLSWPDFSADVLTSGVSDSKGALGLSFVHPPTPGGMHQLQIVSQTTKSTVRMALLTAPRLTVSPVSGIVGKYALFSVSGFSAGETVKLVQRRYESSDVTLASVQVDASGSGSGTFKIAASTIGAKKLEAVGSSSKTRSIAIFRIVPAVRVTSVNILAGGTTQVSLRGFGSSEVVAVSVGGKTLKQIRVNRSGSSGPNSTTQVTIPASLATGTHALTATGLTSGSVKSTLVHVVKTLPTTTPTPSVTNTPVATATPSATPTAEPTATPSVTATNEPTVEAAAATNTPESPSPIPSETPTLEPAATSTPVATPDVEEQTDSSGSGESSPVPSS